MKLSDELSHCLSGNGCKDCESWSREIKATCKGLLQKAYEQIKKYEELEEQGLLLKLPFEIKKGNAFYTIIESKILHLKIDDCKINPYCGGIDMYCINTSNRCDYRWVHIPNDKLFETREQAESALQKINEMEGKE